ncbi:oxaloacetate acetylhydrolase [Rhodocollybia butyracea]|uniref:Oxaloacetate acetylhydrolase n=1 Tax=Rhodocollybia butyracea TaxID=206335 RepID=A0A9P5PEQ7_9AGAR|nr:oxaloacetate acetylhydrolase [Rhodocollybia butyracea]
MRQKSPSTDRPDKPWHKVVSQGSPTRNFAAAAVFKPSPNFYVFSFPINLTMQSYNNPRLNPENFKDGPLSVNAATRLRQMLARPGVIVCPGVFDGVSVRLALEAGFECLYQSGAAVTASRLGQPDLAMATLNDFADAARIHCSINPTVPIIADADTGFGGPNMVARTVAQYARAGIAGLHIEDQVQTKRCGHLMGKELVSTEEFIMRIRAATIGRDSIPGGSDIVIIARSDAAQSLGAKEAINRLKLAADAGADLLFFEGVRSREDLQLAVKSLAPKPVLLNVVAGGVSPDFTAEEGEALGAKLIIYPLVTVVPAIHAMRESLQSLKRTGSDVESAKGMGPKQFFEVMGLDDAIKLDTTAGATSLSSI